MMCCKKNHLCNWVSMSLNLFNLYHDIFFDRFYMSADFVVRVLYLCSHVWV